MPLFNEGNTKQPKANKLVALKTQSYKYNYIIPILIKNTKKLFTMSRYKKIKEQMLKKRDYYLQLKRHIKIQPRY